jgi:hypothetical protein
MISEKKKTYLPVSGRAHLPNPLRPGPGPPGPIWARQPRPPWPGRRRQLAGLGRRAKPRGRTSRLYSRVAGPLRVPHPALLRFAALSRTAGHGVATSAGRCTTATDSPPRRPPGQAEAAMSFMSTHCTSLDSPRHQSTAGAPPPRGAAAAYRRRLPCRLPSTPVSMSVRSPRPPPPFPHLTWAPSQCRSPVPP